MEDLVEAFQIFLKYSQVKYPTSCGHDTLYVNIYPDLVSTEDIIRLDKLGFFVDDDLDCFKSFRFGS